MEEEGKEQEQEQEQVRPALPPEEEVLEVVPRKDYDQVFDRYVRLQAEYENYRKRTDREKTRWRVSANERLLADILPVVDSLELALRHARESGAGTALVDGVDLVLKQFQDVLARYGLEPIESEGRPFDPRIHEAVMRVDDPERDDNTVLEEYQKGYTLGGRTLRPSKVSVSRRPEET